MKHIVFALILLCATSLAHTADDVRTIRVDKTKFSEIYPAVWFSPSTGEITSLKKKSEVPPEEKYEIWIEPEDPEFCFLREKEPTGIGFALIGKGVGIFESPKRPEDLILEPKITHFKDKAQAHEPLVYYCRAKISTCLIMLTTIDTRRQVVEFKWRLLPKNDKIFNRLSTQASAQGGQPTVTGNANKALKKKLLCFGREFVNAVNTGDNSKLLFTTEDLRSLGAGSAGEDSLKRANKGLLKTFQSITKQLKQKQKKEDLVHKFTCEEIMHKETMPDGKPGMTAYAILFSLNKRTNARNGKLYVICFTLSVNKKLILVGDSMVLGSMEKDYKRTEIVEFFMKKKFR